MPNTDSFLPTWIDSLVEGYTLTAEDLPRLARAAQAIRNGVKHHEQARCATADEHIAALEAMGAWVDGDIIVIPSAWGCGKIHGDAL
jgi:hypothetical protein